MLNTVLKSNAFELYNSSNYIQGIAMGYKMTPTYANLFMIMGALELGEHTYY